MVKHEPNYFGKKGFTSPGSLGQKIRVINVGKLDELVESLAAEERLKKKGRKSFLDLDELGYDKLLGAGNVTQPILVKVTSHSERAAKKVQEAGGQILKVNEQLTETKN